MASYTPNLNLILPVGTEKVSRQIVNSNNGIIDSAFGDIVSPTVQGVSTLAELKTYLLAVAGSAEARKNVPVQFNLTVAASPFNSGLYTGIMQKETNGAFSVLCHGYNGGVVEVQYASSTWTIMNLTSEITSLNSKIISRSIAVTPTSIVSSAEISAKQYGGVCFLSIRNLILTSAITTDTKIADINVLPSDTEFGKGCSLSGDDVLFVVSPTGVSISGITGAPAQSNIYATIVFPTDNI